MRGSWVVVIQMETLHWHSPNSNLMTSSKIKNNIFKAILTPRYRKWLQLRKYLIFMDMKVFIFSIEGFQFLNFMKKRKNLTNATLREVWRWHSRSKILRKTTWKIGFKFRKFTFFGGKWIISFNLPFKGKKAA